MLVDIEDVLALPEYEGADPDILARKILAIESAIRSYTNNSFIVRGARIIAPSSDGKLRGISPYIIGGDRVMIAKSGFHNPTGFAERLKPIGMNDGLYDVISVEADLHYTAVDATLHDADYNDVFLVRYPEAIKAGVMDLLKWEATGRDKVGVSSETISRHSVSYYQFNDSEMVMGYPASLMGFLKPFVKARF